jgi:hypothetical protein
MQGIFWSGRTDDTVNDEGAKDSLTGAIDSRELIHHLKVVLGLALHRYGS